MKIWYAISCVNDQQKARIKSLIRDRKKTGADLPDLKLVPLTFDRMRKYEGSWHTEQKELFPECLIVDGPGERCADGIAQAVRHDNLAWHNPVCGGRPVPLPEVTELDVAEEELLRSLCCENCNMPFSRGVIRSGNVIIQEGPLMGHEHMIRRIDRHKRLATIQIPFLGVETKVTAGLEITEKTI